MNSADMNELNQKVEQFRKNTHEQLKSEFGRLKIEHVERSPSPSASSKALKVRTGYSYGLASNVGFKFPRHLVFVHKGVGRGGSAGRTPKEWFNPVIEKNVELLADDLADKHGDLAVNSILIK